MMRTRRQAPPGRPSSIGCLGDPRLLALTLTVFFFLCPLVLAGGVSVGSLDDSGLIWEAANGEAIRFSSVEAIEEFLRTAEVLSMKELGKGTTRPQKVLLEKDGVQLHAVFRTFEYTKRRWRSQRGVKLDFKDKYIFEVAAYELGKLLGLDSIPPVVLRKIGKTKGSLQVWVEQAMNEDDRLAKNLEPPDKRRWMHQFQVIRLFDNLIYNDDRNQGNVLIDRNWKVWMIDATRAFQSVPYLKDTSELYFCERDLWERLKRLDEAVLKEKLEKPGLLTGRELRTLLNRRDQLLEYFGKLIEEKGEAAVIVSSLG